MLIYQRIHLFKSLSSLKCCKNSWQELKPLSKFYKIHNAYLPVNYVVTSPYSTKSKDNTTGQKNMFHYAGDLISRPALPETDILYKYKKVANFDSVPETVKQLCTVKYASQAELHEHEICEMRDRIKLLFGEDSRREQCIAMLTVEVRGLTVHCLRFKKDKKSKSTLVEKIQQRKKYLKYLRKEDYQRFEWLLEELKIEYKPIVGFPSPQSKRLTRKTEAKAAAFKLRHQKLEEIKNQLEREKFAFLKYKERVLTEIDLEIEKYQLDESAIKNSLLRRKEKIQYWTVHNEEFLKKKKETD